MRLVGVSADMLDDWLPKIMWAFENFAERSRGRHTVAYFIDGIRARDMQCWMAEGAKAVALTQVSLDDTKTVTITHCAGEDAPGFVVLAEGIKEWARAIGSKRFEAITRPGWERLLAPQGFRKTHVVLEVDI